MNIAPNVIDVTSILIMTLASKCTIEIQHNFETYIKN